MAQEAGLPILFHVGGETKMHATYAENGLPKVKDFHGGEENFTSVSFMAIPTAVMQTLATLIFDGVLDRFPRLKFGAIELGASWLPSWMRYLDAGHGAFLQAMRADRLRALSMPGPATSSAVRCASRLIRMKTPAGSSARPALRFALFSSDFPHIEGGRNPLKRFGESLTDTPPGAVERFYCDNFIDLMGEGLAPELRRPAHLAGA